ncbi:hypothetical protein BaRGS_00035237 [Batillaria attramentaria]|uniref:Tetraspanin n=1 Tax=Batillaria attramentaria TaxID=370345 RepID=A0ABD0JF72_9CAEN
MAGCISTLGKLILIVLNLVFLLASLALIAGGVVLKFFATKVIDKLSGALDETVMKDFHIPVGSDMAQVPLLDQIGLALLVFGVVLFCISFCACCGACCEFRPLLIVFVILMAVLVLAQAVVGGLFLAEDSVLHKQIKEKMGDKIKDDYKATADDMFSFGINIMNYALQCCGISGVDDFKKTEISGTCCRKDVIKTGDLTCTSTPSNLNNEGCYTKLQEKVQENLVVAAVVLTLLLLLQVVEIGFAIAIVKDVNRVGPV